jgi:hypothetical protein
VPVTTCGCKGRETGAARPCSKAGERPTLDGLGFRSSVGALEQPAAQGCADAYRRMVLGTSSCYQKSRPQNRTSVTPTNRVRQSECGRNARVERVASTEIPPWNLTGRNRRVPTRDLHEQCMA